MVSLYAVSSQIKAETFGESEVASYVVATMTLVGLGILCAALIGLVMKKVFPNTDEKTLKLFKYDKWVSLFGYIVILVLYTNKISSAFIQLSNNTYVYGVVIGHCISVIPVSVFSAWSCGFRKWLFWISILGGIIITTLASAIITYAVL